MRLFRPSVCVCVLVFLRIYIFEYTLLQRVSSIKICCIYRKDLPTVLPVRKQIGYMWKNNVDFFPVYFGLIEFTWYVYMGSLNFNII